MSLEKIKAIQSELGQAIVERDREIEAILAAILSEQHVLLLGPPGTAKSKLIQEFQRRITDCENFEILFRKDTVPEELFGPYNLEEMKQGKFERNTEKTMVTCHLAFLDEIWKSSSACLNGLLKIINERIFKNGTKLVQANILTCLGASNELPQGEDLGALYDRFLARFWVGYLKKPKNIKKLLAGKFENVPVNATITLDEIKQAQKDVQDVDIPTSFLDTMLSILQDPEKQGIIVSNRKQRQLMRFLQAIAYLRGDQAVTVDLLEVLADCLWDKPEDRKAILSVVMPYSNPYNLKALEYSDAIEEIFENWEKSSKNEVDSAGASKQLKEIVEKMESEISDRDPSKVKKMSEVVDLAKEKRQAILRHLGF